ESFIHEKSFQLNGQTIPLTLTYKERATTTNLFSWNHTSPKYFPQIKQRLNQLLGEYHKLSGSNVEDVVNHVAEMHYLMANATFYKRGSAGISDMVAKSLLEAKGIQLSPYKSGIMPDCEAFVRDLDDYKKAYANFFEKEPHKMVQLNG
ncbi:MAG: hypothetical protein U0003_00005, partial [Vampirovibrionales bacterium]